MVDLILTSVYLTGLIIVIWPLKMWLLEQFSIKTPPDGFDQTMSTLIAVLCSFFWPFVIYAKLMIWLSKYVWFTLMGKDKENDEEASSSKM